MDKSKNVVLDLGSRISADLLDEMPYAMSHELKMPQYEGYPYSRYKPKTIISCMFKQGKLYKS